MRKTGTVGFALVASVCLTACSPLDQGAVTLDEESGLPTLVVALCDDEGVVAVRLHEVDTGREDYELGRELWHIEAATRQRRPRFVVGQTPPGFIERKPLPPELPPELALSAETEGGGGGVHGGFFERSTLRRGVLLQDGEPVSEKALRRSAKQNCTDNPLVLFGLPGWMAWPALAGVAGALLFAAFHLIGRRRRSSVKSWPPPVG